MVDWKETYQEKGQEWKRGLILEPVLNAPSAILPKSIYKTEFVPRNQTRDPFVHFHDREKPTRDSILPLEFGTERMLPIGSTFEKTCGDPHRYLNRKQHVGTWHPDNREVFYWVPPADGPTDAVSSPPPLQCAPAGAELRLPRDPRPQISSLHALPFSRRRALTGPTSHLVVKGFDGGVPPLDHPKRFGDF